MAFDEAIPLPRFNLKDMMKKLPKEGEHTVNNCCPISMSKSPKQSKCAEMKGLMCQARSLQASLPDKEWASCGTPRKPLWPCV